MTSDDDSVLQILAEKGLLEKETLESAREKVIAEGRAREDVSSAIIDGLIEKGTVSPQQIAVALAEEFGLEVVDLADMHVSEEVVEILSADVATRYRAFPFEANDYEVKIAICDPLDVNVIDDLSHLLQRSVTAHVAPLSEIEDAIRRHYESVEEEDVVDESIGSEAQEGEDVSLLDTTSAEEISPDLEGDESPIIKYVHMVMSEALRRRASDIHMEPLERRFRIRYRVDGVLHEIESPPKHLQLSIVSRIKLMAHVSIAEKRLPQDGRININVDGKAIDLRVSTLPTAYGESIVMRILDKEGLNLGLPQLGFLSDDQAVFERVISMPDGIFLVTGPTGSGKSTTLYSALNHINHPDRKIITVEDPVEYEMTGINQVQVRSDVGMTFSKALRSMLRQAPNIIMVGEIRDKETAEIAVNASLTGHMVFSTLHTNDAVSAISRLLDIGIKPFLVSASLRAVLAQRLIRRTCQECRIEYAPSEKLLSSLGIRTDQSDDASFMHGEGCAKCNGTGFRGRVGIFEIFVMNEEMEQMVYENASLVALRERAREMGMRMMREDGIRKILTGLTIPEEVLHATIADWA